MRRIKSDELKNIYQPMPGEARAAVRRTLSSLSEEKEKIIMKKKLSVGLAAVIVVLAGLISAAMAGDFFIQRSINWKGEIVEEEDELMPMITFTPEPEDITEGLQLADRALELIEAGNEKEFRIAYWLDENGERIGQTAKKRSKTLESYEALINTLKSDAVFTIPDHIPEGYCFENAEIYLEFAADTECKPANTLIDPSGVIVECYAASPGNDEIVGYSATFRLSDADYHYLYLRSDLSAEQDSEDYMIGLGEDETARTVDLPGAENALLLIGDERHELMIRRKIVSDRKTIDIMSFFHPEDGMQTNEYTEEIFEIWAPLLSEEELLAMYPKK